MLVPVLLILILLALLGALTVNSLFWVLIAVLVVVLLLGR